jgi:hypothetical protein
LDRNPSYDNRMSAPEKSHLCQKVAQQKRDFFQSWRAFQRIWPATGPEKPHLCPFFQHLRLPENLTCKPDHGL